MKTLIKGLCALLLFTTSITSYSQDSTSVRTRPKYLTAMVNYARSSVDMKNFFKCSEELLWGDLYDYNASNWWGADLRYSIDTKLGPLSFDVSSSNISKKVNLYFSLGYYF